MTKAEGTLEVSTLPAGTNVHSNFNTCSVSTNSPIIIILHASLFPSKIFYGRIHNKELHNVYLRLREWTHLEQKDKNS